MIYGRRCLFKSVCFFSLLCLCACKNDRQVPSTVPGISIEAIIDISDEIHLEAVRPLKEMLLSELRVNSFKEIYFINKFDQRIYHYAPDGTFLKKIGDFDAHEDTFSPRFLEIDKKNNVYVIDRKKIYKLSRSGEIIEQWKVDFKPKSLAIDDEGEVYLAGYYAGHLIHKYNPKGKFQKSFGTYNHKTDSFTKGTYSGEHIVFFQNRIGLSHRSPYELMFFDKEGDFEYNITRSELLKLPPDSYINRALSRKFQMVNVISGKDKIVLIFIIPNKGSFFDIHNGDQFVHTDIDLRDFYILTEDRNKNIYMIKKNKPMILFRGKFRI